MLTYRRDVSATDQQAIDTTMRHVRDHLLSLIAPDDDPDGSEDHVRLWVEAHRDGDSALVSVMGEIDAQPDAPYLNDDFDADKDHLGIKFQPYREAGKTS